jgi:hypothetical protein
MILVYSRTTVPTAASVSSVPSVFLTVATDDPSAPANRNIVLEGALRD